jgi:hypothetical protein
MSESTTPVRDRIVGILDEMEYEMLNASFVTFTLTCDFCPQTWETDAPADWVPDGDLMCATCQDDWQHFEFSGEDSYLDSYWESLCE